MFLSNEELLANGLPVGGADLADQSKALLTHQLASWPMLQKGASTLGDVIVRSIQMDGYEMKLQFNPGRIVSSSAKVDAKSIAERKCFLCLENLPAEQKGVIAGSGTFSKDSFDTANPDNYVILVNPFPIFSEHFTIPHKNHVPQRIRDSFPAMLALSKSMGSRYSLFYNGPRCGASAPDHLHFQAGDFGFMTIETTWPELVNLHGNWVVDSESIRIAGVDDGLRKFVVLQSDSDTAITERFETLYSSFEALNDELHPGQTMEEPMFNIISSFRDGKWTVIVFLRRKHRPYQFFEESEDKKILFSPASVDFGGVCITPVEIDFKRIDRALLTNMFNQLSVGPEHLRLVLNALHKI